jgi:hypothetical protein
MRRQAHPQLALGAGFFATKRRFFRNIPVFLNPARTGRPNLLSKERPEAKSGELDRLQNTRPSLDLTFGP